MEKKLCSKDGEDGDDWGIDSNCFYIINPNTKHFVSSICHSLYYEGFLILYFSS